MHDVRRKWDVSTYRIGVVAECATAHIKCSILMQCAYFKIKTLVGITSTKIIFSPFMLHNDSVGLLNFE